MRRTGESEHVGRVKENHRVDVFLAHQFREVGNVFAYDRLGDRCGQ